MGRRAGVISIDIDLGTAKFLVDMDKANTKLAQLGKTATESGHATVSSMQASSAAIRLLENPSGNNVRAIERLISLAPGAAKLMQAIFLPVAGFAAAGLIARLGKEVYDFIQKIEQAPQRITAAFQQLNSGVMLSANELALSSDKLQADIDKLQGKRPNNAAIALDEARIAADKLAASLDHDLAALSKFLTDTNVGGWKSFFTAMVPGMKTGISTTAFDEQVGGKTGTGGYIGRVNQMTSDYAGKLEGTKDPKAIEEIRKEAREQLNALFAEIQKEISRDAGLSELAAAASPRANYRALLEHQQYAGELFSSMQRSANYEFRIPEQEAQKGELTGGAEARKAADEQRKRALEETLRLQNELATAQEQQAGALERIDIAEANALQHEADLHQHTLQNLDIIQQTYDTKRLTEYGKIAQEYAQMQLEWADKLHGIIKGTFDTQFAPGIEAAVKKFEAGAKAAEEWAKATNKITEASASESLRHSVAMAGATGNPNDPLGTLRIQQAIEQAQIAATYEEKLKLAANDLDRGVALNEKNLELLKLQNQLEEKTAELRHKNLDDFFTEMQSGSKTAGDVLYDSMHSALDKVSADFATLLAHPQKTNAGKLFGGTARDLSENMSHEALKSIMEQGLGALGRSGLGQKLGIHVGGKPDGSTEALALWVRVFGKDAAGAGGGQPVGGRLAGMIPSLPAAAGGAPGGGFLGGLFSGLLRGLGGAGGAGAASGGIEDVTSSILFGGMMAAGGDVDPGYIYGVNDGSGREFFQPRTAGTIVPPEKMGGAVHHHSYQIDARGAQLGVENRVARAIESAHNSAVSSGVRASSERAKRTPRRSR